MGLILASQSPYRKELLTRLGVKFECATPKVNEDHYKNKGLSALELTSLLARLKAESLISQYPNHCIIGSDQVLEFNGEIFGKPKTMERARDQLLTFQGQTHHLITAMCLISNTKIHTHVDITRMKMKPLNKLQIENYLKKDEPLDCAGSYKIEKAGISLFHEIDSQDHSAIMGLPLLKLSQLLDQEGLL